MAEPVPNVDVIADVELDADVRLLLAEALKKLGDEMLRSRRHGGQAKAAGGRIGELLRAALRLVDQREDAAAVEFERPAGFGEPNFPPVAFGQLHADRALQTRQRRGDRRLRDD